MASFSEFKAEENRDRSSLSPADEVAANYDEQLSKKSRKRKLEEYSSYLECSENSIGPQHSSKSEAVVDEKRAKTDYRESPERDESRVVSTSDKTRKRKDTTRKSSKSPSKKAPRKSSSPSSSQHKKHKHKKRSRSRERHHKSRKESTHTKRESKHSTDISSEERGESSRKRGRDRRSSSSEKDSRRSPEPLPKKKRDYSYEEERGNSSYRDSDVRKSPERSYRRDDSNRETSYTYRETDARKSPERNYDRDGSNRGNSSAFRIPKKQRSPEKIKEDNSYHEPPPKISSKELLREIKNLLRTEHHHVIKQVKPNDAVVQHVEWCYHYLDPKLPGHITGGRAHLHHFCRVCKRTCLHLLGKYGTGSRKCLGCAGNEMGWKEEEVPSWYYHETCKHCENDSQRRRPNSGGGYGGYRGNRGGWQSNYSNQNRYNRY